MKLISMLLSIMFAAGCAVVRPWESIVIGFIGGLIAVGGTRLIDRIRVDDPLGASSVHGMAGSWVHYDFTVL